MNRYILVRVTIPIDNCAHFECEKIGAYDKADKARIAMRNLMLNDLEGMISTEDVIYQTAKATLETGGNIEMDEMYLCDAEGEITLGPEPIAYRIFDTR